MKKRTINFTIPGHLPSRSNERGHWRKRHALTKKQRSDARIYTHFALDGAEAVFPVTVTLTRVSPCLLDSDNVAGCFKAIRDGIADALGKDDSPRSPITWEYSQRKGNPPCAEIEIKEA